MSVIPQHRPPSAGARVSGTGAVSKYVDYNWHHPFTGLHFLQKMGSVRLRNYSKSITKTRNTENTKQDIEKDEHPTSNKKRISNTEHSTAISVYASAAFLSGQKSVSYPIQRSMLDVQRSMFIF